MAFPARTYKQLRAIHASYKRRGFYSGIDRDSHRFQKVYHARKGVADTVRMHRRFKMPLNPYNRDFALRSGRMTLSNLVNRFHRKLEKVRKPSTRGMILGQILDAKARLRRRL